MKIKKERVRGVEYVYIEDDGKTKPKKEINVDETVYEVEGNELVIRIPLSTIEKTLETE